MVANWGPADALSHLVEIEAHACDAAVAEIRSHSRREAAKADLGEGRPGAFDVERIDESSA